MSFVKTPIGIVMQEVDHAAIVRQAEAQGLKNLLAQLVPATPVEPTELFRSIDRQARLREPPLRYETTPLTVATLEAARDHLLRDPVAPPVDACHPDVACPTCHVELVREHAHQRCPSCGWRTSCCF